MRWDQLNQEFGVPGVVAFEEGSMGSGLDSLLLAKRIFDFRQ